ncbi:D-alanyl-lipoteichoic acid acyltransferase DltB, MBOAT superfamily [Aquimarina amphilecti]|uniref:D-alanyl-lipoteichoic acid acyltransferase DltB, MBOAT superfamily n=2 Tax=Aquimarina amphilecti TaxID=1038014 RepID=A0A1H7WAQ4_AQUAM|nr:MBOAT family O-acyltransferase [Aquimarina amphilecti]SEM18571.1 D-alanyl-lipoteichoic acid acyltransferase DltB, MBOAT superfamily [Aquimarina amphilecti]
MQFNTIDFALFFPIVFVLYWFVFNSSKKVQNVFLLAVSYLFYSFWDWRFLSLIFLSSMIDFLVARQLETTSSVKRKILLGVSLFFNLGVLFVFKYFNFFIETFAEVFLLFGTPISYSSLQFILPVGISFYTFQTLSYTIDVYRERIRPTNDIISFFAFVSFFPQLVAGPIERASNLLPQFQKSRYFKYSRSIDGLRLILGGLFKKMVIADNCAIIVNRLFEDYTEYSGSTLFCGAIFFGFQIYGDFSGYSDIAIGSARLLGFDLKKNFSFPYLSKNLIEFWRRWHISLSTWFRDYVYIALGGNRVSKPRLVFNILVVFLLSGLWHGANLTFIFWGLIHGIILIFTVFINNETKFEVFLQNQNSIVVDFLRMSITFFIVTIAWVFFRADSITEAFGYLERIFSSTLFSIPQGNKLFLILLIGYLGIEWFQKKREHLLDIQYISSKSIRYLIYYVTVFVVFYYAGDLQTFIYFQF